MTTQSATKGPDDHRRQDAEDSAAIFGRSCLAQIHQAAHQNWQVDDLTLSRIIRCAIYAGTAARIAQSMVWPQVVCAWCQTVLAPGVEPHTHGMCERCLERELDAMEDARTEMDYEPRAGRDEWDGPHE